MRRITRTYHARHSGTDWGMHPYIYGQEGAGVDDVRSIIDFDSPPQQIFPKAASFLRAEIKRIVKRLPPTQQKETQDALMRTVHAIESVGVESQRQLEHLRLIASASTLTLLFAHEVRTVIGTLGAVSQ